MAVAVVAPAHEREVEAARERLHLEAIRPASARSEDATRLCRRVDGDDRGIDGTEAICRRRRGESGHSAREHDRRDENTPHDASL